MTRWVSLGEVVEQTHRRVPVESAAVYRNVGVLNRGRGLFEKSTLAGSETKYPFLSQLSTGDLVYSKLFGWEGAVAVVREEFDDAFVSSEFPTFRIDQDQVNPGYLRHVVGWEGFVEQLRAGTTGLGQRRQRVNPQTFLASHVPLPPLTEQCRIASHLDAAQLGHPDRSSLDRLSTRIVTLAAEGAPTSKVGDFFISDRDWIDLDESETYSPIGVRGFGRGIIHYPRTPAAGLSKMRYFTVQPDRLMVSNIKAWEGAVTLTGQADRGRVASNRFLQYQAFSPDVTAEWAFRWLASPNGTAAMSAVSPGPADRNRTLSMASFEAVLLPTPSPEIQELALKRLNTVDTARRLAQQADKLRAALLPAARNEIFSSMR